MKYEFWILLLLFTSGRIVEIKVWGPRSVQAIHIESRFGSFDLDQHFKQQFHGFNDLKWNDIINIVIFDNKISSSEIRNRTGVRLWETEVFISEGIGNFKRVSH